MRYISKSLFGLLAVFAITASGAAVASSAVAGEAEITDTITGIQYFRRSESAINNIAPDLRRIAQSVDSLYRAQQMDSLVIIGNASPDGGVSLNRELALNRARSVANYIDSATSMPDSMMKVTSHACTWRDLLRLLRMRDWSNNEFASTAIEILSSGSGNVVSQLRKAHNGHLWKWLDAEVFPLMRAATVIAYFQAEPLNLTPEIPMYEEEDPAEIEKVEAITIEETPTIEPTPTIEATPDDWRRYIYVKSNLPAWLCLWTNVACEIDITPHLSATLPIYYSGFNYFTRTLKFRTFALQPELRFWPRKDNHGFFMGAHFGMVYYNIALKGDYRYQDKDANTPALGGGLAIGYRFRLNSDPNLSMEATIGGGIYHLDYDIFHNYTNGLLCGRRQRTFYGIDQAALSIIYRFGLGKNHRLSENEKEGGEQ